MAALHPGRQLDPPGERCHPKRRFSTTSKKAMSGSASASSTLPSSLHAETRGDIAILRLNRAEKRNALNDETVLGIETFFNHLPESVKAVVLHGDGDHFSA